MAKVRYVSGPVDKVRGKASDDYARKGEELELNKGTQEALEAQGFVFEPASAAPAKESSSGSSS